MNCIQLYLFLQLFFNIRTSFPREGFMLCSEFILLNINCQRAILRSAGEAVENSAARRMAYAKKFSISI